MFNRTVVINALYAANNHVCKLMLTGGKKTNSWPALGNQA